MRVFAGGQIRMLSRKRSCCLGTCIALGATTLLAGDPPIGTFTPRAEYINAPLKPVRLPDADQSILLGRSAFQVSRSLALRYEPLEDGGFRLTGGQYRWKFNRQITHGRNNILTGDLPIFRIETSTGSGVYREDRSFPLFPRDDARSAKVSPVLGTLSIGIALDGGRTQWLHELGKFTTEFRPGYTSYDLACPDQSWKGSLTIAPAMGFHGFVCSLKFDRPVLLKWQYGGVYWEAGEKNDNQVRIEGDRATITEGNLPNAKVIVGWDGDGSGSAIRSSHGESVTFLSRVKKTAFHIVGTWGVTEYDRKTADDTTGRLDTESSGAWPEQRERLKRQWFDCYIGRALDPDGNYEALISAPDRQLTETLRHWDERRREFQIRTPDPYLNAIVNFERCISDYHRMGPGLVLSSRRWMMYSHISVGWYGKIWAGDHQTVADYMRLFGAMQDKDGFIRWISPSLHAYNAENNTPYWVDHVWWLYAWTGDEQLVRDLWAPIKKAVDWERTRNDPDGDGLYQSHYEYWNCDSNGKGPKAAAPTSTAWAMFDRAARMATIVGDETAATEYRSEANKIRSAALSELWNDEKGILGSIGGNGIWRGHPQTWEQYLGINNGMLPIDKGLRAMRWLESHYGFEPNENIKLLMNCDWWPLRWSVHWVPTGDTLLAALAGMKCGDTDLWWPYVRTVAMSSFRSDHPAVRFAISNTGSGSGGIEFIDSDDPHMHATVRGPFGITPEIHNDRLHITPAFPSSWSSAEIESPVVSYRYSRNENTITLDIRTPNPLVKVVRAYPGGPATTTPKETTSTVTLDERPEPIGPLPEHAHVPTLTENTPPSKAEALTPAIQERLELVDLSGLYNTTLREMVEKRFVSDFGRPVTIKTWWHTVGIRMNPGPEVISAENGVRFLLKGRSESVNGAANNILALSSWGKPYPLPAGAKIEIGRKLDRLWLLLQNYVSPIKNYIPNGEIVLHYVEGEPELISLVPPYNLDCYFQEFSRQGVSVPLGELQWRHGWSPVNKHMSEAQANALTVLCDPTQTLKEIEIRATCSEGVIGVAALTLLPAARQDSTR